MTELSSSKHISVVLGVKRANPNGDPDAENMPRQDSNGKGIISSVCLKRKIRNQLQDKMENVLYYNYNRSLEEEKNIKDILISNPEIFAVMNDSTVDGNIKKKTIASIFTDVRMFGSTIALKKDSNKKNKGFNKLSLGIQGVVSVQQAESTELIMVDSMRITKSLNSEFTAKKSSSKDTTDSDNAESGKGSDTMGMEHFVEFGVYKFNIHISKLMADKIGFTEEDYQLLLNCIKDMFNDDYSEARPAGSMEVLYIVTTDKTEYFSKYQLDNMVKVQQPYESSDFADIEIEFEPKQVEDAVVTKQFYSLI